jgi:hypothetical protein
MAVATQATVKERPIIFSGPMVRAILDGTKTQSRRVVKPDWGADEWHRSDDDPAVWFPCDYPTQNGQPYQCGEPVCCPYGKPGDLLWVRETWQAVSDCEDWLPLDQCRIIYAATDEHPGFDATDYAIAKGLGRDYADRNGDEVFPWRSPIHMARKHSRILLEVVSIRVERLQAISERDAIAEGIGKPIVGFTSPIQQFWMLWNDINADRGYGWAHNPWVWVIEFKRVQSV